MSVVATDVFQEGGLGVDDIFQWGEGGGGEGARRLGDGVAMVASCEFLLMICLKKC